MPAIHITIDSDLNRWSDEEFYALCEEAFSRIVNETPVDTGACQEAWNFDFSVESCEIWNDTEYVSYLEEGWSSQASAGFIESILQDLFGASYNVA